VIQAEKGEKKADMYREFRLVHPAIKRFGEIEPKLLMSLNRTDRE
jgi:hypothetical protein